MEATARAVGDEFENYVKGTRSRLVREAYGLCGDWHEAEDLAQVTLQKLHGCWARLDGRDRLFAYTRRMLVNVYLSERRHSRWAREEVWPTLPDQEAAAQHVEERVLLLNAVRALGPRQREIILLRYWSDQSVEGVAQSLGCRTGTVTSQAHRALRTLRTALGALAFI